MKSIELQIQVRSVRAPDLDVAKNAAGRPSISHPYTKVAGLAQRPQEVSEN